MPPPCFWLNRTLIFHLQLSEKSYKNHFKTAVTLWMTIQLKNIISQCFPTFFLRGHLATKNSMETLMPNCDRTLVCLFLCTCFVNILAKLLAFDDQELFWRISWTPRTPPPPDLERSQGVGKNPDWDILTYKLGQIVLFGFNLNSNQLYSVCILKQNESES